MKLKHFFSAAGFLVGMVSLLGYSGIEKLTPLAITSKTVNKLSFFLYLTLIFCGLTCAFLSRKTPWLHKVSSSMLNVTSTIYASIGSSFVGWGGGLILYYGFILDPYHMGFSAIITLMLSIVLSLPLIWVNEVNRMEKEVFGFKIRERKFLLPLRFAGGFFIILGAWGMSQPF